MLIRIAVLLAALATEPVLAHHCAHKLLLKRYSLFGLPGIIF